MTTTVTLATGIVIGFLASIPVTILVKDFIDERRQLREYDKEWGGDLDEEEDVTRIQAAFQPVPATLNAQVTQEDLPPGRHHVNRIDPRVRRLVHLSDGTMEIPVVSEGRMMSEQGHVKSGESQLDRILHLPRKADVSKQKTSQADRSRTSRST